MDIFSLAVFTFSHTKHPILRTYQELLQAEIYAGTPLAVSQHWSNLAQHVSYCSQISICIDHSYPDIELVDFILCLLECFNRLLPSMHRRDAFSVFYLFSTSEFLQYHGRFWLIVVLCALLSHTSMMPALLWNFPNWLALPSILYPHP